MGKRKTKKKTLLTKPKVSLILLVALAAAAVAVGFFMLRGTFASSSRIQVCNSLYSVAPIKVWDTDSSITQVLRLNDCTPISGWYNLHDNIRVDVNPEGYGQDVDSYKSGEIGGGWNDCHKDSENPAANPPDYAGVRYRNYAGKSC
jgi:hypothetical protein